MKTFLIGIVEATLYHLGQKLDNDWMITQSLILDQKYLGERRYTAAKDFIHGGS
jgi:hypothetical protein